MGENAAETPSPDDLDDAESDRVFKVMEKHVIQLCEHFDTVQIIATRHNVQTDNTGKYSRGSGNWYANFGAVREWVEQRTEESRVQVRKNNED